jgi:transcriptional regulator with XRE-family HTH domain
MKMNEKQFEQLKKNLGRRIGELRAQRGFTQAQFAEKLERSVSVIQAWETGRNFTIKTLFLITTTLNYPIKEIFKKPVKPMPKRGRPRHDTRHK